MTYSTFSEAAYLAAHPDVAAAVARGEFASGLEHFEIFGINERRILPTAEVHGGLRSRLKRIVRPPAVDARVGVLSEQVDRLAARVRDLEILTTQQQALLKHYHQFLVPPPKHLQVRVGRYSPDYVSSAFTGVLPALERALRGCDIDIHAFRSVLDFGSGCGRTLIGMARSLPDAVLHGTDIDAEAIAWCRENYPHLAAFSVAPHLPPMSYADASFDFVVGISVMTHLPEEMQFAWLDELRRVTRTEGVVVLTTHGLKYHGRLNPSDRAAIDRDGFIYVQDGYGTSVSLPEFYATAMHRESYIRERWSAYFDVLDVLDAAMEGNQDIVVLRRRP